MAGWKQQLKLWERGKYLSLKLVTQVASYRQGVRMILPSRQKNIDNTSVLLLLEIFFFTAEAQRAQRA